MNSALVPIYRIRIISKTMPQPDNIDELRSTVEALRQELAKVIVGQRDVIDQILISIFSGGHSLLVGVPGLAKTMLVKTLAEVLGLSFNRIQFTPDLMPADITGTEVIQEDRTTGQREFRFVPGPVFTEVLLADEINRTPPKTQAALLEAMQEGQVTVGGKRHELPAHFFVLATQNPIEQEGTYPLPEAQLDRFMMEIVVNYPSEEDEYEIVTRNTKKSVSPLKKVLNAEQLTRFRETIDSVAVAEHDVRYAISLIRATRDAALEITQGVGQYLSWGAGPRASEWLVLAAKAHAAIAGRDVATESDIQAMLAPVLRHRLVLNFNAEADDMSADEIISKLKELVASPANQPATNRLKKMITRASK